MEPHEFVDLHRPALERDEVRHGILLTILSRIAAGDPPQPRWWPLGAPGECAAQAPNYPIVLGDVTRAQVRAFAEETRELDYPAIVGPGETACWFADHAATLGVTFAEPIPQQIHVLSNKPRYPGASGQARAVTAGDAALCADWMIAFQREAVPHDPVPPRERLEQAAASGDYSFWVVDGEPVSLAGIVRRTRSTAAIAGVYTPPALRGRGYAGSVTAAVAERAFEEGKTAACLYTDLRNPFSNRCYVKIGFAPVCESWCIPRRRGAPPRRGTVSAL